MFHFYNILIVCLVGSTQLIHAQCPITVSAGDDIYLCAPPTPTQLNGEINGPFTSFTWMPLTGMTGSNTLNPTVTVTQTTNYILTGRAPDYSSNLIDNGDFESGNSGFSSDYIYNPGNLVPEGVYDVIDNPQLDHPGFAPCTDHTSGSGNMMAVNGAGTPNQDVWCQTVPVTPNSAYVFSAWVATLVAASPALLQFSINGTTIGPIFAAPGSLCNWQNFFASWNSGAASSATICIVNQNTTLGGNDFALDDLVFAPVCEAKDTVTVHVINLTAVASPQVVTIPCDGANVTLNGTGSSTGPNITYSWDTPNGNIVSGQTTLNPVVNAPGSYTLTVHYEVDGNVCEKEVTVNVILSPSQLLAWISPPNPIGCGSSTSTLIGNSTQPGASSYQWSTLDGNIVSGQNSKNCVVNMAGTYTLLVTNLNTGCTATAEVTVGLANNPPVAMATAGATITCLQNTSALSGTGSTTGAGITYNWTTSTGIIIGPSNVLNASAGAGGTYILGVTNTTNNCTSYDTVSVISNTTPPVLGIQTPGILDCDTDTLDLSATALPSNTTVSWMGGTIVSGQNTLTPAVTSAGTYTLQATNPANGCTSVASTTVSSNYTPPIALIQAPDTLTCSQPSITLSGTGSSSGPNFQYAWTAGPGANIISGNNTLQPLVNAEGVYNLLVTNSINACTASASALVTADTNVVKAIASAPDTIRCNSGMVPLLSTGSSSGPFISYNWTTTTGQFFGNPNAASTFALLPGTYELLVTNTMNGCAATDLAIVIIDTLHPQANILPPALITCANPTQVIQAVNLSLPGVFTYAWTGVNILSGANTLMPSIQAPGIYSLTITNQTNGCTSIFSTLAQQETGVPIAIASVTGPITCAQSNLNINTTGSSLGPEFQYAWQSSGGGNILSGINSPAPLVNAAGNYQLTITNTNNGCTTTTSATVLIDTITPVLSIQTPQTLTCYLPAQTLIATNFSVPGNFMYQWTIPGTGNIVSGQLTLNPLVSAAGIYQLSVTNIDNGCTSTLLTSVPADISTPNILVSAPSTITCSSPLQTIPASNLSLPGNFSYAWSSLNGNFVSNTDILNPIVDAAGAYQLTVTNLNNGCSNTVTTMTTIDTLSPMVLAQQPATITCAQPVQTIQAQNLSLPGNFNYVWSTSNGNILPGNQNNLSPQISSQGNYALLVTNTNNGCSSNLSVSALQNTSNPVANAGPDNVLSCSVNSLQINGSGTGNGPLNYQWTVLFNGNILSGANAAIPTINAAGSYQLLVTNTSNGCTDLDTVVIANDANAPFANAGTANLLTCDLTQQNLGAMASSGPGISYLWTSSSGGNIVSGNTTLTPVINAPGTYQLSVTNSTNGCTSTAVVAVLQDIAPPNVDAGLPGTLMCNQPTVVLNATASAGNGGALTYSWTGPAVGSGGASLTPSVLQAGTYTLSVENQFNGCTATDIVTVGIDTIHPNISAATSQVLSCSVQSIPINGVVIQPAANYSIQWGTLNGHFISGQNTLTPTVDEPGLYTLIVQNNINGCSSSTNVTALQDITPPTAVASAPTTLTCDVLQVSLSGIGSSPAPGFTYQWAPLSNGVIVSGANTLQPVVNIASGYGLTVTNTSNGCTATAQTTVPLNTSIPVISIAPPQTLTCVLLSTTLNGSVIGNPNNFSAFWSTGNGQIVSGQNTFLPNVNQPGTYTLIVENNQNGCTSSISTTVNENTTPPQVNAGPDGEINCNSVQITLQASSNSPGLLSWAWSTNTGNLISGGQTATPVVDAPGTYQLVLTSQANGCTASDQASVVAVTDPAFSPDYTDPNCLQPKGTINFGPVSGGKSPFTYSIDDGQAFQASPDFTALSAGTYELVVKDANGCTDTDQVTLEEPIFPMVDLPGFVVVSLGDSVQLQPVLNISASQIATWIWTPADSLSCSDCPSPYAHPVRTGTYQLQIVDINGCKDNAKVQVRVNKRRDVFAPNIFTPNDDGQNDRFTIYGKGVRKINFLRVFDRWGTELFYAAPLPINDENAGWDGQFRGTPLNPAVFVWVAEVEFIDGEVEILKGDVTLFR